MDTSGRNEFPPQGGWLKRSLRDRVRSSVIREELGVEPLLLRIERSQLRWLGHLFRMPPGRLPREVFQAGVPPGGGPGEDPGHAGETMSLGWPGNASGIPPEELEEVSGISIIGSVEEEEEEEEEGRQKKVKETNELKRKFQR
ncbi:hypothetical protein L3Q82_008412 [Scortum barcoo]|uniref:Uncharacterized protein n=1 Tax=Scortum barcoo TaxID=214431 RepID=A0ACB8XBK7_9TELE|nr:hypothetical protein L3Q82_008412 [Scortum barcoo]